MDAAALYEGAEPYIFISYSHKDRNRVFPVLDELCGRRYRLWYDVGIQAGEQWTDELAEHINGCAVFLLFLSESYDKSEPCMQEIRYANSRQRAIVPIWLTDKRSLSGKLQYQLKHYQGFSLESAAPEDCAAWMDGQKVFQPCRRNGFSAAPTAIRCAEIVTDRPAGPSPYFVGRCGEIAQIETAFRAGESVVALYGVGGIGKSEICRKLFHEYALGSGTDLAKSIGWVTWRGNLPDTFYGQLRHIREGNAERHWHLVRDYVEDRGRDLLIVLDNGDDMTDAQASDLIRLGCRILLTSRRRPGKLHSVRAGTLSEEQCRVLYRRALCGDDKLTDDGPNMIIDEILRLSAYHTLAVELLAKTQAAAALSAKELLDELRENGFHLPNIAEEVFYDHRPEQRCVTGTEQGEDTGGRFQDHMARLFDLSVLRDDRRGEDVIRALRGMSLLAPNVDIPVKTAQFWLDLPNLNGLNYAVKTGWLNGRTEQTEKDVKRFVSIHPMIAATVWHTAAPDTEYIDAVVCRLEQDMVLGETEVFKTKELVVKHAVALDRAVSHLSIQTAEYAKFLHRIGVLLNDRGDYKTALSYLERAAQMEENTLGNLQPDTAATYNEIGFAYRQQGSYEKALDWFYRALHIQEKTLGTMSADTARTLNNIGVIYYYLGNYSEALNWYRKTLLVREKELGPEHPQTAFSYNNIGNVYLKRADYANALLWLEKARSVWEKHAGSGHPDTAFAYNNIGVAYLEQGNCNEALKWLQKAFRIRKNVLGLEYYETVKTLHDIGRAYYKMKDYQKASEQFQETLDICAIAFGPNHPLAESARKYMESMDSRKNGTAQ